VAEGQVYQPYYQGLSLTSTWLNGAPWQVSGLPRGLSTQLAPAGEDAAIEGDITGIPQVAGTFTVTVTVTSDLSLTTGGVSVPRPPRPSSWWSCRRPPLVTVLSSGAKVSGQSLPVGLFCTYLTCSGDAKLTAKNGVVLANAPYSLAKTASGVVKLELTPAGSKALAKAMRHPVNEVLTVSVHGGQEVRQSITIP
jgi:hypothetical protein